MRMTKYELFVQERCNLHIFPSNFNEIQEFLKSVDFKHEDFHEMVLNCGQAAFSNLVDQCSV